MTMTMTEISDRIKNMRTHFTSDGESYGFCIAVVNPLVNSAVRSRIIAEFPDNDPSPEVTNHVVTMARNRALEYLNKRKERSEVYCDCCGQFRGYRSFDCSLEIHSISWGDCGEETNWRTEVSIPQPAPVIEEKE